MRFIHIADSHLGLSAFTKVDPETGMNLRERLIYEHFLESIEEIISQRPDVVVHAGDLFDRVKPKTRAYTTVFSALERLGEEEIPFIAIAGNHSMPRTRHTPSPFEVLEYHPSGIHAAYRYRYEPVEIQDAVFHLIPNMLCPEDYRTAFEEIKLRDDGANVLVTHGLASVLSDRRLRTVAEHEIDITMLSSAFDYIALGHFHGQKQVADNAWYSGSAEYCNFGEIDDVKGGLIVDTEAGTVSHLNLPHTPMLSLGTIDCQDLSASSISQEILRRTGGGARDGTELGMITLEGITEETEKGIDRKVLSEAKREYLHLKFRIIREDENGKVCDVTDPESLDFIGEFRRFLETQPLERKTAAAVSQKGEAVLKRVLARHAEEGHADK